MNLLTADCSGARHISNNLNLYGFGSPETALIQCIKEFTENAIDACKQSRNEVFSSDYAIIISIKSTSDSDILELEVSDNGTGISDPQTILKCFNTTKSAYGSGDNSAAGYIGKFGVGLTACLIYAELNAQDYPGLLRIVSKKMKSLELHHFDYGLNSIGDPILIQTSNRPAASHLKGTKVKICLPPPIDISNESTKVIFNRVISSLVSYYSRLDLLPTSFFKIEFNVQIPSLNIAHSSIYNSSSLTYLFNSEAEYKNAIHNRLKQYNPSIVDTCVNLTDTVITSMSVAPSLLRTKIINLYVYRSVNGVPLLDYGEQDSSSCLITSAIRSTIWKNFGWKLQMNLSPTISNSPSIIVSTTITTENERELSEQQTTSLDLRQSQSQTQLQVNNNSSQNHSQQLGSQRLQQPVDNNNNNNNNNTDRFFVTPIFQLISIQGEECDLVGLTAHNEGSLIITVDLVGPDVDFGSYKKSHIDQQDKTMKKKVLDGMKSVLLKLKSSDKIKNLFMGKREFEDSQIENKYIPSVASSIAKIILHTKRNCEEHLPAHYLTAIGIEDMSTYDENQVKEKLENMIKTVYRSNKGSR